MAAPVRGRSKMRLAWCTPTGAGFGQLPSVPALPAPLVRLALVTAHLSRRPEPETDPAQTTLEPSR